MNVLATTGLNAGYGTRAVIKQANLTARAGMLTALIGANGSGKSTLLRTLAGVQPPLAGAVTVNGHALGSLSRRNLARNLAMVFTDRTGGGGLTVQETVEIGRHPHTGLFGHLSDIDRDIVREAINAVGIGAMSDRMLGTLSDGERQKVMIARALAQDTPLIILDEPTAFLDVAGRIEITALLRRLADDGKAVILSTHDVSSAIAAADMVWVVEKEQGFVRQATKEKAVSDGTLDSAFPGLHFDKTTYTYMP